MTRRWLGLTQRRSGPPRIGSAVVFWKGQPWTEEEKRAITIATRQTIPGENTWLVRQQGVQGYVLKRESWSKPEVFGDLESMIRFILEAADRG